ncbi:MAG TPA: PAC2 family protein [Dehalococcoidia bacterium]|nr:PAC2 family protein [Dehalococcoidia bacterium]
MEHIKVDELPRLRQAIMLAAFGGWGDAGEIATTALRLVVKQYRAKKFASFDPEEFYDFTKTRPTTKILRSGERRLEWPANDFYCWRDEHGERDYLVLVGADPHLRWKLFTSEIIELAQATGVELVLTLGGFLGEVAHSRIAPFTGRSSRPDLHARLAELGVGESTYQGPTGIHSVLHDALERAGLGSASLWGAVPHYIPMVANPKVCAALARKLCDLLALDLDLREMDLSARQFERQVNEAIKGNPEIAEYVRQLEASQPEADDIASEPAEDPPELPSGEAVVRDLEDFLRQRQQGGPGSGQPE